MNWREESKKTAEKCLKIKKNKEKEKWKQEMYKQEKFAVDFPRKRKTKRR